MNLHPTARRRDDKRLPTLAEIAEQRAVIKAENIEFLRRLADHDNWDPGPVRLHRLMRRAERGE